MPPPLPYAIEEPGLEDPLVLLQPFDKFIHPFLSQLCLYACRNGRRKFPLRSSVRYLCDLILELFADISSVLDNLEKLTIILSQGPDFLYGLVDIGIKAGRIANKLGEAGVRKPSFEDLLAC